MVLTARGRAGGTYRTALSPTAAAHGPQQHQQSPQGQHDRVVGRKELTCLKCVMNRRRVCERCSSEASSGRFDAANKANQGAMNPRARGVKQWDGSDHLLRCRSRRREPASAAAARSPAGNRRGSADNTTNTSTGQTTSSDPSGSPNRVFALMSLSESEAMGPNCMRSSLYS